MKNLIWLIILFLIVGCSTSDKNKMEEESVETTRMNGMVIAENLSIPWTINKYEDTFYLSQRVGTVIKVNGQNGDTTIQGVDVTKEVLHTGEGGLLGFILAPDFEATQRAFAYHTYQLGNQIMNRIVVLKLENNRWVEEEILLEGIPGGRIHNGGRLKIGPDGKLYATTGDAGIPENAQNIQSLAGKILRMNGDGTIPNDNPFTNSYVYSYGHRNPQGLAWDSGGAMYSTEHGQTAHDEINLIKAGQNYGWPIIQGDEENPNMVKPLYHTGDQTWAPSGIAIHENKLYIATLRGSKIVEFDLADQSIETFFNQAGRLRDVHIENDFIYTITNNRDGRGQPDENDDKLIRLTIP